MIRTLPLLALGLLAACKPAVAPEAPTADAAARVEPATPTGSAGGRAPADGTATPLATDAWAGKWIGVEGMFLEIVPAGERGRYAMTIKGGLDGDGEKVTGMADGDTIRFVRAGTAETLRAGDGAATGLKWLADKKNCLIVKQGEGYCRD